MAWSLRTRVITGALLWTVGLLGVAHVISFSIATRYPHLTYIAHGSATALLAILCLVAGVAQVRRGFTPFSQLRAELGKVREGRQPRVAGAYAAEVQPLVDELNALLEHREKAIARAVARAGDLAHGLKTPLAVLGCEVDRARAEGREDLARGIDQQIERMRRQVDYHLAQARASASGANAGQRVDVAESAAGLIETLRRLYASRELEIECTAPANVAVRVRREDLDEMLGNLLDNACKWARTRVRLEVKSSPSAVTVVVDDDGAGLAASMREAVLQRGVRGDDAAPGSGFGLAIVRDVAELYGGTIELTVSEWGGVRAVLTLPPG